MFGYLPWTSTRQEYESRVLEQQEPWGITVKRFFFLHMEISDEGSSQGFMCCTCPFTDSFIQASQTKDVSCIRLPCTHFCHTSARVVLLFEREDLRSCSRLLELCTESGFANMCYG